ncbi:MAG TPA: hypothetical protein VJ957_09210 [Longimicrobiales bacterium]|nr:hypothetical protein [Longimicrobiales bacterium]
MSPLINELPKYPVRRLERVPPRIALASALLVAIGVVTMIAALLTNADRAWQAYTFNWLFFATVAQAAVLLGAVVTIARGLWSRPVRRLGLAFVAFLPIAYLVLFPPLLLWAPGHLFPWWQHRPTGNTGFYLSTWFLVTRNVVFLGALLLVSLWFAYWALRPDLGLAEDVPPRLRGLYDRMTRGWRGQEAEEMLAHKRLSVLSPVMVLLYVFAFSFVAFDFVMSLQQPHWVSTLFGPYFFMGGFLGGIAATFVVTLVCRRCLDLDEYIEGATLHDMGKLLFAFCIFWAYLFWAQYMVQWYGNMPHEQVFLVIRLGAPYRPLTQFVLFALFIVPFFALLGVKPKTTPTIAAFMASVVLIGLWTERYILVYPTLYPHASGIPLGYQEVGIGLGFLGIVIACLGWFQKTFPMLQIWQPATEIELMGKAVEVE